MPSMGRVAFNSGASSHCARRMLRKDDESLHARQGRSYLAGFHARKSRGAARSQQLILTAEHLAERGKGSHLP